MEWFNKEKNEVISDLSSDSEKGLTFKEAKLRLIEYGRNELVHKKEKGILQILLNQLKETMVIILIIAGIVSLLISGKEGYLDAVIIFIIVLLNTAIGFFQEFKAEKAIQALQKMAVPFVRIKRNGEEKQIPSKELVPGDLILIEAGNIIPADARIIESSNLKVQESALTGESEPVSKSPDVLKGDKISVGDRKNMIHMGTVATFGRCLAVVTGTGMKTELGKIAGMLQNVKDEKSPLQKRLAKLGIILSILAVILIMIVVGIALFQKGSIHVTLEKEHFREIIMTAISMAVAAIPEGLPAVVTIALAIGAGKMLKRNALIRNLPSVETLGSVTVICSDKTGTLTQNKMTVTQIILPEKKYTIDETVNEYKNTKDNSISILLTGGLLCNDAAVKEENKDFTMLGDPTEGCLIVAGIKNGLFKSTIENQMPRISDLPFSSERKRMTTVHKITSKLSESLKKTFIDIFKNEIPQTISFTKGSVDGLMEISDKILLNNKITKITPELKEKILKQNAELAENGIRVLGVAFKSISYDKIKQTDKYEKNLIYVGMVGIIDPVRPEIKKAVTICKTAGIRAIMITGDHPLTAKYIAKNIGITENDKFLTGNDLSNLSFDELKEVVKNVSVYARVSPEHKMKLIDALQSNNHIVSMTGDGVNDAPALKSADIGVAMGITGTDVSKQSSDMVLLDDNFATIVTAVKEGRTIYDNIKRFIKYILTGNFAEIMIMLFAPFLKMPLPLHPIQILWINLVTDGAPGIAMGYEKSEKTVMSRSPYKPNESIFSRGVARQILWVGSLITLLCLGIGYFFYNKNSSTKVWQTMIFTTLTFCQMMFALSSRSNRTSIFMMNPFTNLVLLLSVLGTFVLQLLLIYIPFLQNIFKTESLSLNQLLICLAASLIIVIGVEIEKLILRLFIKK